MPFQKGHKINLGRKHSKEAKTKMSEAHKGSKNPMFGVHLHRYGSKNNNWKGGERKDSEGRIVISKREHPFARKTGYIYRSRLVMEKKIGRYLKPCEVVHHKGIKYPIGSIENIQDDRPENLELFPNKGSHIRFHNLTTKKYHSG